MISYLRGTLVARQAPLITVEVGGVGYDVETPMSTYLELPSVGNDVTILTHFLVREDAQLLYGFSTEEERALFRNLLKVSGVGARIGLAILSGISVNGFRSCVVFVGVATLVKVPGGGREPTVRLYIAIRARLKVVPASNNAGQASTVVIAHDGRGEALRELIDLGYIEPEEW